MAKSKSTIDEKALKKGELRKLNALRKSIGDKLAEEAFAKWHAEQGTTTESEDHNIALLETALTPLIEKLKIPRGTAYAIRRGRGRFIIEPVSLND